MTSHAHAPLAQTGPDLDLLLGTGPFHAALRAAIRARGLPLERLQWHLAERGVRIGVSSLSLWQHGHTVPRRRGSEQAVRALEEILQLPPASLVRLMMVAREVAGAPGIARQEGLDESEGAIGELLDSLPGSRRHDLAVLSRENTVNIGADRSLVTMWDRTLVRALADGADRYIVRWFGDPGDDLDQVRVSPMGNCRVGEVRRHPSSPVMIAEMLFDEALREGDTWVLEFRIDDGTGAECCDFAHGIAQPMANYLIEVRFDPAALPRDCHVYARAGLNDGLQQLERLPLNRHHAVHHLASNVTAGVLGLAWTWPAPSAPAMPPAAVIQAPRVPPPTPAAAAPTSTPAPTPAPR
jgi:hypothetical protein